MRCVGCVGGGCWEGAGEWEATGRTDRCDLWRADRSLADVQDLLVISAAELWVSVVRALRFDLERRWAGGFAERVGACLVRMDLG